MGKRIEWVDIAKGIGIIIVVIGHMSNQEGYVGSLIWSFHMPLFFFLSGMFMKPEAGLISSVVKRARQLLIPFFVFSIIACLVIVFVLGEDLRFLRYVPPKVMWFLLVLFLTDFLCRSLLRIVNVYVLLAFNLIIALTLHELDVFPFYALPSVFISSFYYLTGYLTKKHEVLNSTRSRTCPILLTLSLLSFAVLAFMVKYFNIHTAINANNISIIGIIASFVGIYMIICGSMFLEKLTNNDSYVKTTKSTSFSIKDKLVDGIKFMGVNSLTIMATHQIFISLYGHFACFGSKSITKLGELLFVFGCSILCIFIFRGRLSFLIGKRYEKN